METHYPFDLGSYSRSVTAANPAAQRWFDRGLLWTYGYHHEEAVACYERAVKADPDCAMAHFGIAYAIGPNYNKPWEAFDDKEKLAALEVAQDAISKATSLLDKVTPVERALIQAISNKYPHNATSTDVCTAWNDVFFDAMRQVYQKYPDDLEVCCFFVEAIMNRTPWKLWDVTTGKPAEGANTLEAIDLMDRVLSKHPQAWEHPGLLHMYIHIMEMSPHPEKALRHGDRLMSLVPDAGHLLHMATHIDILCGDYANVVTRNHAATIADKKLLSHAREHTFYTLYRCHNYHFKVYGALFLGQAQPALEAAMALQATLTEDLLRQLPDWLEAFFPILQHVYIRFGMWEEILDQPLPTDAILYCVTTATMRYARAVALANLGKAAEALVEKDKFQEALQRIPATRSLINNTARDILNVAEQMMLGETAYHAGNIEEAFGHLRRAIYLDDNLPYDEPWGWMQPVRHALGALLLDQGRLAEAEAMYRADLGLVTIGGNTVDDTQAKLPRARQHPNNVWSLHGLFECLTRRGERVEAQHIKMQLDKAIARADVPIRASCFCRSLKESEGDMASTVQPSACQAECRR